MAPRFIGKTALDGLHPVTLDGRRVLDLHDRLVALLRSRAGADAAALFAEPVATWPAPGQSGSVSWYSELQGAAEPLGTLPPDRRGPVEGRLRDILARLEPLFTDAEAGPLLRRAAALADAGGVLAIGGTPVLLGWGVVTDPSGTEEDAAARGRGWMRAFTGPAFIRAEPPAASPATPLPAAQPAAASPVGARPPPPMPPASRSAWDWALLPAALLLAALFLGLGLYAGIRAVAARVAERPTTVTLLNEQATKEAIDRQRAQNDALEKEIDARRRLLAGNVCQLDPATAPRLGPDRAAAVPPGAVVPPPPGGQAFQGTLAELLTQGVVLIIAPQTGSDGSVATGTGFFVAPGLVVTNRHVIEDADPAQLVVTSRKLARTTRAEIVAQTESSEIGGPDIALLRVAETGIQPLAFSTTAAPLDQVIAAGFPGLLLQADEAFDRLRHGDTSAVPEVILTDGRINAIQSSSSGMKIMPHSAAVSGGNSGGPLSDACGRVVGINTFITANREQVAHANYAQKADGVVAFLRDHGAAVADVTGPCAPGGPTAAAAPGPAAPNPAPAPIPAPTPVPTPAPPLAAVPAPGGAAAIPAAPAAPPAAPPAATPP